jgi:hypothetical protein
MHCICAGSPLELHMHMHMHSHMPCSHSFPDHDHGPGALQLQDTAGSWPPHHSACTAHATYDCTQAGILAPGGTSTPCVFACWVTVSCVPCYPVRP